MTRACRVARSVVAPLLGIVIGAAGALGQAPIDEARVKAAFVYSFLQFVEWPAGAFAGPRDSLVVAIIGDTPTAEAAATLLDGRQVNNRGIAIRRIKHDARMSGIHVVFIGGGDTKQAQRWLDGVSAEGLLSIGDIEHFASAGGVIGLLVEAKRVRFEINPRAATTARLKISSKLLALARIVQPKDARPGP